MTLLLQTVEAVAIQRAHLTQAGFHYVEVENARLGDKDSGKAPVRREWQITDPTGPPIASALNTGILCNGLRAIDLDIDNPTLVARCQDIAEDLLGVTLRRFRADSARCLLLYRAADGEPHKIAITGRGHDGKTPGQACKIEVLGHGNQFVAFGQHWEHGMTLQWEPHAPGVEVFDDLIAVTEADVATFLQRCAPIIEAKWESRTNGVDPDPELAHVPNPALQADDPLRVARALEGIPNGAPADWEAWNRIGMAVWTATGGSTFGWELWNAWSARNPSYSPEQCRERWTHYPKSPPTRIGAGTIFYLENLAWLDSPPAWPGVGPDITSGRLEPIEPHLLPPRPWAYGRFLLFGSTSVLGAVDGVGKGVIAVATLLAMVTGVELLGEKVWRRGPVAIVSYEDDELEWQRRIAAACRHHRLDYAAALAGIHFLRPPPGQRISFATLEGRSGVVSFPHSAAIIAQLQAIKPVLLIIDPFNHAHSLQDGNNNVVIAQVAGEVARIAQVTGVAALVLHHLRKGASGDVDDLMGATSLRATFRAARILARMTREEAQQLDIPENERWRYIRIAGTKENYAPPPDKATWFKLNSVDLGNATSDYPDGDSLGVADTWKPPPMFEGMEPDALEAVFHAIRNGDYSPDKRSKDPPWVGTLLVERAERSEDEAHRIVGRWLGSGLLVKAKYNHGVTRKERVKVLLDWDRASVMIAQSRPFSATPD